MKKLKGVNWDINTDTNTINIHNKLTTEQLARIVDSAADYERGLSINSEKDSIEWTINIVKGDKLPEPLDKAIRKEVIEGIQELKRNKN